MTQRQARNPHEFWMQTCGYDTYHRSPNHARLDTPWNAFTKDSQTLVCTLWNDEIAEVFDPAEARTRRFVRLGGKLKDWKGVAVKHGTEARNNLEKARADRIRIIGFEAEPNKRRLAEGDRTIERFFMDRAHRLKPHFGIRGDELEQRLPIQDAFRQFRIGQVSNVLDRGFLFELTLVDGDVPGAAGGTPTPTDTSPENDQEDQFEDRVSNDEYALRAIPVLVSHLLQQSDNILVPVTYQQLAELIGRTTAAGHPWARGMGDILERVTALISSVTTTWSEPAPFLTSIVVLGSGPDQGLPGEGVRAVWPGYESLNRLEKQAKVLAEYQRILQFGSRWNDVLIALGMQPIVVPPDADQKSKSGGWGGGESDAHKALKRYVREHPEIVGADASWEAREEYALRSGDEVDVVFKSAEEWIGVEVKSNISDRLPADYERGLYQTVKYLAVLSAQASVDHPNSPPRVRSVLILQSHLPAQYRAIAQSLRIKYYEGVGAS